MNVKCSLGDVLFSNHHEYRRVAGSQDREEFKHFNSPRSALWLRIGDCGFRIWD